MAQCLEKAFVDHGGPCPCDQVCSSPCLACVSESLQNLIYRALGHRSGSIQRRESTEPPRGGPGRWPVIAIAQGRGGPLPPALSTCELHGRHTRSFLGILGSRNGGEHEGSYSQNHPFTL